MIDSISYNSIQFKSFVCSQFALDATLLNTQHYKVRIKGKWSNPGNKVAPSPTPRCSSY